MNNLIKKIQAKLADKEDVLRELLNLPGTELNSYLLELFRLKSMHIKPAELLKQFDSNRFAHISSIDIIQLKELEIEVLNYAKTQKFTPLHISPLAPFGTSSTVALVNQNNIVTALRGSEVVSDATNVLALQIAKATKKNGGRDYILKYCTTHRHVRAQHYSNPEYTAHFSVFCLASGGWDGGNYSFEIRQLSEHFRLLYLLLSKRYGKDQIFIKYLIKENTSRFHELLKESGTMTEFEHQIIRVSDFSNKYYKTIQFKISVKVNNQEIELADGGDVDWTQQLLENKKHRLFISGLGLDFMSGV